MTDISRGQSQAPADDALADRRRPGRMANVNPELIPILRQSHRENAALSLETAHGEVDGEQGVSFDERDADDLAPARGIMLAVVLGGLLWLAILWGLKLAFHLRMG